MIPTYTFTFSLHHRTSPNISTFSAWYPARVLAESIGGHAPILGAFRPTIPFLPVGLQPDGSAFYTLKGPFTRKPASALAPPVSRGMLFDPNFKPSSMSALLAYPQAGQFPNVTHMQQHSSSLASVQFGGRPDWSEESMNIQTGSPVSQSYQEIFKTLEPLDTGAAFQEWNSTGRMGADVGLAPTGDQYTAQYLQPGHSIYSDGIQGVVLDGGDAERQPTEADFETQVDPYLPFNCFESPSNFSKSPPATPPKEQPYLAAANQQTGTWEGSPSPQLGPTPDSLRQKRLATDALLDITNSCSKFPRLEYSSNYGYGALSGNFLLDEWMGPSGFNFEDCNNLPVLSDDDFDPNVEVIKRTP